MAAAFGVLRQIERQDVRLAGLNRRKPVVMLCALSHILHGKAWQRCRMQDPAGQSGGRCAGKRKHSHVISPAKMGPPRSGADPSRS